MAINLAQLEQAADRHIQHCNAINSADPVALKIEKSRLARRHVELFVPPPEKLLASKTAELARDLAVPLTVPGVDEFPSVDLIPEIISRDNDLRPIRFLQLAMLVARSVGRVRIADGPITDEGDATGFLIAPGLLMTNWHVLKSVDFAAAASVVFDDEENLQGDLKEQRVFRLRPDIAFVNDEELDFAIVEVSPRTASGVPLSTYGYLRLFEQTGKLDPNQREAANIIQHPGGGSKKIAIRDNYLAPVVPDGVDPGRQLNSIFYGSDTLKGSSGSPVCSDQWYVVGLHRGGVPATTIIDGKRTVLRMDGSPAMRTDSRNQVRYLTNEGTRISRVHYSLRQKAEADKVAAEILARIQEVAKDPRLGPVDLRTAPILLPLLPSEQEGGAEEITRRSADKFEGAKGYKPTFLGRGFNVPLPRESSEVKRELALLKDSTKSELKYVNYSIKMNADRRTAFYAAGNIDGSKLWNKLDLGTRPARPTWSYDPRMDTNLQPDDSIFSNAMQRGHLFKREDAGWGRDRDAIVRADLHSFTITNATPMIANFNNVEWGDLEDLVTRECDLGHKVSYFAGPVFRSSDPFFNELRREVPYAERKQGMRVPQSFWKIVAWVESGLLKSAGFILSQKDEIAAQGPIEEEINFGTYRKTPIGDIEKATGLKFPELVAVDTINEV